jgi:hypothetical protein
MSTSNLIAADALAKQIKVVVQGVKEKPRLNEVRRRLHGTDSYVRGADRHGHPARAQVKIRADAGKPGRLVRRQRGGIAAMRNRSLLNGERLKTLGRA